MGAKRQITVVRAMGFPTTDHEEANAMLRKLIEAELTQNETENSKFKITIVPSCVEGSNPVGLIDFDHGLPTFLSGLNDDPLSEYQIEIDDTDEYLSFDKHFHGFTQLYAVEPSSIIAE